ncbi:MAG TPA: hypothetical protein VGA99_11390 [bacterium]
MKLLFSEYKSAYSHYIFPYAIWAIPEKGETPAMIFNHGFLPASREFAHFYLCRQVRVDLSKFSPSSENRRIMRKCQDIRCQLISRNKFHYTPGWREFCKHYADIKFGKDVMTYQRLDSLFNSKIVTHLLLFTDSATKKDVGVVTLYLEKKAMAYYYYSFYDLNYYDRNLGMFMMTTAVDFFADERFDYVYLGSCYSRNAMYKTQFSGAEFFNGFHWSADLKELKFLIQRDQGAVTQHLIETEEYREKFHDAQLAQIADASDFTISLL